MTNTFHGTYYELLELKPGTPQHEVTRAYERAKQTYSSDNPALYTVFTPDQARELLTLIDEAYVILGNTMFRNRYDEILKDPQIKIEELKFADIVGPIVSPNLDKEKVHFRSKYTVDQAMEEFIAHEDQCDGPFLKRIREYKNISIEKLCEITRISSSYIIALEKNSWSDLPAPVFVRGFIVQLCRIMGLDEKKTVDSYMKIYKAQINKTK